MIISVPRERKTLEKRVAITPYGARQLILSGHTVLVEKDAGLGSFFTNQDYLEVGCEIVNTLEECWKRAELLVKVKEPAPEEYQYFRKDLVVFDYLHLAGLPEVAKELIKSGMTGISYELVQMDDGRLPLLEPMSEVAGKLAVQLGAHLILTQKGGRGVLLGGTDTVSPGEVTVIGAGIAGQAAVEVAYGMGARVHVLDINEARLSDLAGRYGDRLKTYQSTPENISKLCPETDVMILAVLIPGAKAPRVLTREQVGMMQEGSVLIDISIDQGGAAETIRTTSLENPTYVEAGVIHYGVPNMPSQVARTSTKALTKVTLPYIQKMADLGFKEALKSTPELLKAVNTYGGQVCNLEVAHALNLECVELILE